MVDGVRLGLGNFDFANETTSGLTHRIHPYPAKYIPQIPRKLIEQLSSPGDVILDPFCGSGTTLVEALAAGRHAIGLDANPLACLISRAKTSRAEMKDLEALRAAGQLASEAADLCETGHFESTGWRPEGEYLDFWFPRPAIEELAEALKIVMALPESIRDAGLTAFSSIVVWASRQDSDTRYVRREKNHVDGQVLQRISRALRATADALEEFAVSTSPSFRVQVRQADIRFELPCDGFDAVICSPPYPNAYSYHLYHQSRMLWLQMDQPTFKKNEIGSHRKYSAKGKNAADVSTFRAEMDSFFELLSHGLKPGGYACLVMGDSKVRGEFIDNAEILAGSAIKAGFREVERTQRNLDVKRKAFNPKMGRIRHEHVLLLELERPKST